MLNLGAAKLKQVKNDAQNKPREVGPELAQKRRLRAKRCESSADFYRLMSEANLEEYFADIKPFTFRSEFVPLSVDQAKALMKAYKDIEALPLSQRKYYDWKDNEALRSIAKGIDDAKEALGCEAIFVRTSSRSPKDAALSERGVTVYLNALDELKERQRSEPDTGMTEDNMKLHALYVMGTKALRVTQGSEGVDLLIRSNRLQDDLNHYTETPSTLYQIIVREFANFHVDLEFRAFVWEGKVTAITQYNEYVYFPGVVKHKEELETLMVEWTKTNLIGKVKLPSFVIDLMLVSQTPSEGIFSNLRVFVVEINPFAEFAGTGLFKWEDEFDADTLYGDTPFEFRIVTKPTRGLIKTIPNDWKMQLDLAEAISGCQVIHQSVRVTSSHLNDEPN